MPIPDDESLRYKVLHDQDFDLDDGGGGGFAPASRYEAGGADPITNLGTLTAAVTLTDGSFDRAALNLDGTGLVLKDGGGNTRVGVGDSGAPAVRLTDASMFDRVLIQDDGGGVVLHDATGQLRSQLWGDGTGLFLTDAGNTLRVQLVDDGSGLTLYDSDGHVAGGLLEGVSAGVRMEGFDSAGNLLGSSELANGGDQWEMKGYDSDGNQRTDLSVYDEGFEFNHLNADGSNILASFAAFDSEVGMRFWDGLGSEIAGVVLTSAGVHLAGTGQSAAIFGASPYGQDTFVADPTGAATDQDDEARAAIIAIRDTLVARGWMAAS